MRKNKKQNRNTNWWEEAHVDQFTRKEHSPTKYFANTVRPTVVDRGVLDKHYFTA